MKSLPSATSGLPRTIVPSSFCGRPTGAPVCRSNAYTFAPSSTKYTRSPSTTGIDRPSITPFFCQIAFVAVMSPAPVALNTVADPIDVLSRFSSDCET